MTVMDVAELEGAALDWAVAKCEGYAPINHTSLATIWVERVNARGVMDHCPLSSLRYSTNWAQGGPIIEREKICTCWAYPRRMTDQIQAVAQFFEPPHSALVMHQQFGPTPLIAAMRCYVAARLGETIPVPNALLP